MENFQLVDGWQCKQRSATVSIDDDFQNKEGWIAAQVPGCVHLDLLAAGRIPDPFPGLNENEVQWIGEADWLYRSTFPLPSTPAPARTVLCCDGLDTFATVWVNGTQVLQSENMFVPQRVDITELLSEGTNELRILFESALLKGKQLEAQMGQRALWNGDSSRLYVRKAQYHYGWDWGPTLLTAGPWQAVRLESYTTRIADLHCPIEMSEDLQMARLPVMVELEGVQEGQTLQIQLYSPTGELVAENTVPVSDEYLDHSFIVVQPQLWYPHGYGEQPLYHLAVTVLQDEEVLDQRKIRLGFRRLRLVQEALEAQPGTSFFFEINNIPIFCGGANWIPADSFTTRITPDHYRAWLQLAVEGNMAMVRVWGGGIYETDVFYDLCDELGLLVWQDFLFACGIYPAHSEFRASVRDEAEANVRRLRHHPALVLWCGNNEDYSIAGKLYDPNIKADFLDTAFPAREIYEQLLPEICEEFDSKRPYWPGSPFGGIRADDLTVGDTHIWSVWHGGVAYQDYPKLAGRFVSEFGMQAFPEIGTIASFAPPEEWYPQSRTLDHHNKDSGGPRRLAPYIIDNVRIASDLEGYIYVTQFVQAEALGAATRGWRRLWQGPGREYTSGVLVWQLNDCWPVTSWAIVDYALRPKPAYYVMKRELAPFSVGLARSTDKQVAAWAVNGTRATVQAELEIQHWGLDGTLLSSEKRAVELAPNRAVEIGDFAAVQDPNTVVAARLLVDEDIRARATLWVEPFKYLNLPDPGITVERLGDGRFQVSARRPAKGVWLSSSERDAVLRWSDNMLDLVPNDPQIVTVEGLGKADVQVKWLR